MFDQLLYKNLDSKYPDISIKDYIEYYKMNVDLNQDIHHIKQEILYELKHLTIVKSYNDLTMSFNNDGAFNSNISISDQGIKFSHFSYINKLDEITYIKISNDIQRFQQIKQLNASIIKELS